ncbi:MAG: hypothetical protein IJY85_06275 [Ruminococcus sp.]|nr:hypothetical protein [Ruminococcus sp.]
MEERKEQEACMKIYTPRAAKTPTTQDTTAREPEQVRIWNGSRVKSDTEN